MIETGGLLDFSWSTRYSSATHDLIQDFFVPALSRSRYYYRIAGFFSSTAIAAAARGISAFVENGEKMYLIIGSQLSQEDVDAINTGTKKIDATLYEKWDVCKEDFENNVVKKRFELLAWLIANDKLEIKIGVNKDKNGNYLSSEDSLFHEKVLIFEDYDGNRIQIDGSINETGKAWRENRESFCVHRSWEKGHKEFINSAMDDFNKIWSNQDNTSEVMDLPIALKKDLISIRPKNVPNPHDEIDFTYEELNAKYDEGSSYGGCSFHESTDACDQSTKKSLRNYQEEAIQAWVDNEYRGILEMATGTGKTFTALNAIKQLDLKSKLLLIGVPQRELANQWTEECKSVFGDVPNRMILCYSNTGWKMNIEREIRQSKREKALCIIIVVFGTMRGNEFVSKIGNLLRENMYLIIDEVHEIGSSENRKILSQFTDIKYRLGLSATPERAWDEEGNSAIQEYFGKEPIFVWDMEKAIRPPDGYEPCLCQYKYHLHDCSLTGDELDRYEELSEKIKKQIAIKTNGGHIDIQNIENGTYLQILLNQRADIIKECKDKFRVLKEILVEESDSLNKCLVYCNDKDHMNEVAEMIEREGFKCRKFYGDLNPKNKEHVFDSFKNGDLQFLVAIKCLDQGIDIPVCNSAIILTSSRNPREYIQRRGRILRLHKNKEFAIVHDMFVFPRPVDELKSGKSKLSDYEITLIKNQLQRISIFMDNAINGAENMIKKLEYGDIIIDSME
ncbi:DEAD/DEAH box helicase family protein [Methanococcoides burtonii]|uniref:DEAD/helicase-like protein n=1 Tax=Methanococcoides burtonii (strain DSM 6242 / NBRC 107633 / OCM 468 / ACE-M) TaxID=259564 RepID=Q12VT3_METBU|nr:DEAD/DEAH box helicase family protein [Methanococcoides burtonii]ABE52443.1 DEAD/helicase-like protein [Methanococcoides burtonii DSM 6242]